VKKKNDEQQIIAYLLGKLTDEEQTQLEEKLFVDDEFYEQLQALKAELADDYASGELSTHDRETFARRYLTTTQGREQLAFSRVMARSLPEIHVEEVMSVAPIEIKSEEHSWRQLLLATLRTPALQYLLAAAMLILVLGGFWLFSEMRRLRSQLEQARAEQIELRRQQQERERQTAEQRARNEELSARLRDEQADRERLQKKLEQSRPLNAPIPAFILSPGSIRGSDEPEKLILPRFARRIKLQLDLGGDDRHKKYRAEVRTTRGNLVWSQDTGAGQSTPLGKAVSLTLPANLLPNGEYELTLKGVAGPSKLEDIGFYYFNVIPR